MTTDREVAQHYARPGLEKAILDALRASGKDVDRLQASDLSGVDEFHLGWLAATQELARMLRLEAGHSLIDIGSGIGGPARHFADVYGCTVVGIDLTDDYVRAATALTQRCGLSDRVSFRHASALAIPYPDESFDRATLIHVGMNIADKRRLFGEVRRVTRRGGLFGVYDVMRVGPEPIAYPVPWAANESMCHVDAPERYRDLLARSGFRIESERDQSEVVLELAERMRQAASKEGTPPVGLHILMGSATPERLGNVMKALQRRAIAPIEMIVEAV